MNRNEWKFAVPSDKLLVATHKKLEWHRGRLKVWQIVFTRVKDKLQKEGLVVDEGVDPEEYGKAAYAISNRASGGPVARVDDKLASHLSQAARKVREHERKIEEYEVWAEILPAQGGASQNLDHQDWLFFFGHIEEKQDKVDERITESETGTGSKVAAQ